MKAMKVISQTTYREIIVAQIDLYYTFGMAVDGEINIVRIN